MASARRRRLEAIVTAIAYGLFGLLAGAITTFLHRGRVDIGGLPIWLGLIAGTLALTAVAIGLRLYLDERLPGRAFALGVLAAIGLLTTGGAGHSVIIPGSGLDDIGLIWIGLAAVAVALPAIWPRLPKRAAPHRPSTPSRAPEPPTASAPQSPAAGGVGWSENSSREGAPE